MAGLQTEGFRAQLPLVPRIPDNIGKVDVKGIYDRVVDGLRTADLLRTEGARQRQDDEAIKLATQQAQAEQAVLPSATAARAGQNTVLAAQNSPEVAGKSGRLAADRLDTLLADTAFQNSLTPAQRVIFAQKGLPTTTTGTVTRTPDGNTVVQQTSEAKVGGETLPISTSTETTPTAPVLTPIAGANGTPLGTVVSAIGPDGKPQTHIAAAPIAALNNIAAQTQRVVTGTRRDEMGNLKETVQNMVTGAAGGAPKPVGSPYEIDAGSDPTVVRPEGQQAPVHQPFISKDAGKAIEDVQGELQTLQQRKVELENISNASERFINEGVATGKFIGPLRSFLGESSAQEFTGSVQNALSTALQPLRGTGRVSNTEFNQALSALPRDTDTAQTIRSKMQYLNLVTDWGIARQQAILDNLGKGLNRYQAFQKAFTDTPVPPVPDFYTANAEGAAPIAPYAPPAQAAQQGTYQIKATTPEGIRAEAAQAKAAGYKSITTPDGVEHVLTNAQ